MGKRRVVCWGSAFDSVDGMRMMTSRHAISRVDATDDALASHP
jgi:hypothetical protein